MRRGGSRQPDKNSAWLLIDSQTNTFANAERKKTSTQKIKQKQDKKELGVAQKLLDIARVRGYDAQEVFTYDLVKTSYLFDEDGLMKKLSHMILWESWNQILQQMTT